MHATEYIRDVIKANSAGIEVTPWQRSENGVSRTINGVKTSKKRHLT